MLCHNCVIGYRMLGAEINSGHAELKKAYRDVVRLCHPDRVGTDERLRSKAETLLKGFNAAYCHLTSCAANRNPSETTHQLRYKPQAQESGKPLSTAHLTLDHEMKRYRYTVNRHIASWISRKLISNPALGWAGFVVALFIVLSLLLPLFEWALECLEQL